MKAFLALALTLSIYGMAKADPAPTATNKKTDVIEELDPFSPDVSERLQQLDLQYEALTGKPAHIDGDVPANIESCYRNSCEVYAYISKSKQKMYLYQAGVLKYTWNVSTGRSGKNTPSFDKHPDGRIYDAYNSSEFPGGDYKGLGNMPYAVFVQGGFAIHGTPFWNWMFLGHAASHGCVRMYPKYAFIFNRLVRQYGVANTWITIAD